MGLHACASNYTSTIHTGMEMVCYRLLSWEGLGT